MSNYSELIILIFSLLSSIGYGDTGAIYKYDTKAVLKYDGYTEWFAPTEIHSICKIEINYFPFDEQSCPLRFGSWTYTGIKVMDVISHLFRKQFQGICVYQQFTEFRLRCYVSQYSMTEIKS